MPSPSNSLNIAELSIYPPLLLLTLTVIYRHGIHRQSGWLYLSIFCLIRIIGPALGVAAKKKEPSDDNLLVWSAILGSVGMSPLLLASIGLLKRVTDETSQRVQVVGGGMQEGSYFEAVMSYSILGRIFGRLGVHQFATSYRSRFLQLLQLPAAIALIICIVGGSDLTASSTQSKGQNLIKAGLVIFVIIYVCLFLLIAKSASEIKRMPAAEKRILSALIVALPLLGVRILFGLLAYFSSISTFSPTDGNVLVRVFMAVLEEILIVIAYTLAGILVPKDSDTRKYDANIEVQYLERRVSKPGPHAPR